MANGWRWRSADRTLAQAVREGNLDRARIALELREALARAEEVGGVDDDELALARIRRLEEALGRPPIGPP